MLAAQNCFHPHHTTWLETICEQLHAHQKPYWYMVMVTNGIKKENKSENKQVVCAYQQKLDAKLVYLRQQAEAVSVKKLFLSFSRKNSILLLQKVTNHTIHFPVNFWALLHIINHMVQYSFLLCYDSPGVKFLQEFFSMHKNITYITISIKTGPRSP